MSTNQTTVFLSRGANILIALAVALSLSSTHLLAQRSRITRKIDTHDRVTLRGHMHPRAQPADDQGPVSSSVTLPYVTLVLKRSVDQETALTQLLAGQQDPSSPDFRHWLTPEEYADRFGVSQDDVAKIAAWLQSEGLTVVGVARGRNWIACSGAAPQIETPSAPGSITIWWTARCTSPTPPSHPYRQRSKPLSARFTASATSASSRPSGRSPGHSCSRILLRAEEITTSRPMTWRPFTTSSLSTIPASTAPARSWSWLARPPSISPTYSSSAPISICRPTSRALPGSPLREIPALPIEMAALPEPPAFCRSTCRPAYRK